MGKCRCKRTRGEDVQLLSGEVIEGRDTSLEVPGKDLFGYMRKPVGQEESGILAESTVVKHLKMIPSALYKVYGSEGIPEGIPRHLYRYWSLGSSEGCLPGNTIDHPRSGTCK